MNKRARVFSLKGAIATMAIIALIAIPLFAGCTSSEKIGAEEVVRKYNERLPDALRRGSAKHLDDIVSDAEWSRIDSFIKFNMQKNQVVLARNEKLEIKSVRLEESKGSVQTKETWVYQNADAKQKKPIGQSYSVEYDMTYFLIKQRERWFVDKLVIAKETEKKLE